MEREKIDNIFRDNLENTDKAPKEANWSTEKNWKQLKKQVNGKIDLLKYLKYAAVLLIGVGITVFFIRTSEVKYTEISTGNGEKTKVKLSDGSVIWLNSNTTVHYPEKYTKKTMEIFVDGEAYFELLEKRKNPIIILAENTSSTVYESAFNIRAISSENNVEITLTKGKVEIDNKTDAYQGSIALFEGERAMVHKSNKLIFAEQNNDANVISWKTGEYKFNEMPLFYVIKKLEQTYNIRIDLDDEILESCKISLSSKNGSAEKILWAVAKEIDAEIMKTETGYKLYKGSCNNVTSHKNVDL